MVRRDKTKIILELLENIRFGNHLLSHLAYSSFLPYNAARRYVDWLEMKGLVETRREGRKIYVFLTDRGRQAISQLHSIIDLVDLDLNRVVEAGKGGVT